MRTRAASKEGTQVLISSAAFLFLFHFFHYNLYDMATPSRFLRTQDQQKRGSWRAPLSCTTTPATPKHKANAERPAVTFSKKLHLPSSERFKF
ncbi:hypothetical protein BDV23DRAFT_38480 [Aspergillus alliaceus]|uniref:Uncharacterized protein n=1 Tax=Petromyces alliaceus TaxID=209559 RepID=A0A5N7BS06_PETAA|nr:hypothetical protein BDV23DRAFT_38480 [Aspergillus alliaceus]